ncbi:response regulator [Granulicella sp. 5B5]|uniref:response regulator n=1 Tax=Granulicella sp. 5B5 TaxID=1617967 RepID=UPI0015F59D97|nr:response regulator transcription factor [Granulicella sp. 5B5]QMV17960.1 response regulator [Granulicella sp. 5B5]
MSDRIRLMLVEDHHMVRQGLVALLSSTDDLEVVASIGDGLEAVEQFRTLLPDVTLIDLQLPKLGGVETIRRIRAEFPNAHFIVLTTFDGDEDIYRALQAGARAYLLKGMPLDELVATIHTVHKGRLHIPPAVAEKLAQRISGQELTARELSVLERIVAGRANKDIAADLCISEATVKTHVNNLLGKLGVADRTHAATVAIQRGLVSHR